MVNNIRYRAGWVKTAVLRALTVSPVGSGAVMASLGGRYSPGAVRVCLWRLRQQGLIEVAGGLPRRCYVFRLSLLGEVYLSRERRREAARHSKA